MRSKVQKVSLEPAAWLTCKRSAAPTQGVGANHGIFSQSCLKEFFLLSETKAEELNLKVNLPYQRSGKNKTTSLQIPSFLKCSSGGVPVPGWGRDASKPMPCFHGLTHFILTLIFRWSSEGLAGKSSKNVTVWEGSTSDMVGRKLC